MDFWAEGKNFTFAKGKNLLSGGYAIIACSPEGKYFLQAQKQTRGLRIDG
jgi:hypothetical protein